MPGGAPAAYDAPPMARTLPVHRVQLLAAAILFSTGSAAIKASSFGSWQIAGLRSGIAAAVLLLLLPQARRGWSWRTLLVGLAYATTMLTYVFASKLTTAANTIFLQNTAPLFILLLAPWLLKERSRRRDLLLMLVLAVGMVLFFVGRQAASTTAPDPFHGNLLAAGCGLCWGLTVMGLRWLARSARSDRDLSVAAVTCGNLTACVIALPFAFPIPAVGPLDWLLVLFLGVFQIALAYVFLTRGVRHVAALEASLLLLLEPVLNPVWAWLIQGEQPTLWALAGGIIIIVATATAALLAPAPAAVSECEPQSAISGGEQRQ